MRTTLGVFAVALSFVLVASGADAQPDQAKKRRAAAAGSAVCGEAGFQACMNKCISNMMISNGSRITQKCSYHCHARMNNC